MNINVAGLSTLRKKEDKPREKKSDRSHNLQAYLDEQYGSAKVKKKKRKKKYASSRGLEIVDADIDTSCFKESSPKEGVEEEGALCPTSCVYPPARLSFAFEA